MSSINEALGAGMPSTSSAAQRPRRKHGFCFRFKTPDGSSKVFVNVLGDAAVGLPVHPSGAEADETYIETRGVDNLQIPIAVGEPRKDASIPSSSSSSKPTAPPVVVAAKDEDARGATSAPSATGTKKAAVFTVDVVVHDAITEVCTAAWRIGDLAEVSPVAKATISRMTALALDWVARETGLHANPRSVKIITDLSHRKPNEPDRERLHRDVQAAAERLSKMSPEEVQAELRRGAGAIGAEGSPAPQTPQAATTHDSNADESNPFLLPTQQTPAARPKRTGPLIQEVVAPAAPSQPAVRKGFLNDPGRAGLYGPEGSAEGVLPEGAGDPLGYIPQSVRSKCKIIDTRQHQQPQPQWIPPPTPQPPPPEPLPTGTPLAPANPTSVAGIQLTDVTLVASDTEWDLQRQLAPTDDGQGVVLTVRATVPSNSDGEPAVASMGELDLDVDEERITCVRADDGRRCFVAQGPALNDWAQEGLSSAVGLPWSGGSAVRVDTDTATARFLRKSRAIVIRAELRLVC